MPSAFEVAAAVGQRYGWLTVPVEVTRDDEGRKHFDFLGVPHRRFMGREWDPIVFDEIWSEHHDASGLALMTDEVLEVEADSAEGELSLQRLKMPRTPTFRSKRGIKYLYRRPKGGPWKKYPYAGVEVVRAHTLVIPPTPGYEWLASLGLDEVDLAPAPARVLKPDVDRSDIYEELGLGKAYKTQVTEGERHDELVRRAGNYRRLGDDPRTIAQKLWTDNENICEPPLSKEEVAAIAKSMRGYKPAPVKVEEPSGAAGSSASTASRRWVRGDQIQMEETSWLWGPNEQERAEGHHDGRIPLGMVSLIAGQPGNGKTQVSLDLAAAITRGTLPGEFHGTDDIDVVFMTSEDLLSRTVIPRFVAAQGRLEHFWTLPFAEGETVFSIDHDLADLRAMVGDVGAKVVVLDPFMSFLSGDVNTFKDADVRRALVPLVKMIEELDCSVVGIMHLNKDMLKSAIDRISSSGAFAAVARSIMFVAPDPNQAGELNPNKVLAHGKSNVGEKQPSLSFSLEPVLLAGQSKTGGDIRTSKVKWLGEVDVHAEDLLKGLPGEGTKAARAQTHIRTELVTRDAVPVEEFREWADGEGISRPTLDRARKDVGARSVETPRTDGGTFGKFYWTMLSDDALREKGWVLSEPSK